MSETHGQVGRFAIVGVTVVLLDALVTFAFRSLGVPPGWAKGIGFATGAVLAYFANLRFTFRTEVGRGAVVWFAVVYLANLFVNTQVFVLVIAAQPPMYNALGLGDPGFQETIAFFGATGTSATLNFLGMKYVVFRPRAS